MMRDTMFLVCVCCMYGSINILILILSILNHHLSLSCPVQQLTSEERSAVQRASQRKSSYA
ncbi:hypothetical protein EON65_45495 [archaeon]|nr:MAG: hypothetical protein EON65_45495 [archaeon]